MVFTCTFLLLYNLLFSRKIKDKKINIIFASLIIGYFFISQYIHLINIENPIIIIRNFLFLGMPLFSFGLLIHKNENKILKIFTNRKILLIMLIGILETIICTFYHEKKEIYIGTLFIAFAIFIYALKNKKVCYSNTLTKLFKCSTGIYVIHILINRVIVVLVNILKIRSDSSLFINIKPFIICIISTIISIVINKINIKFNVKRINLIPTKDMVSKYD